MKEFGHQSSPWNQRVEVLQRNCRAPLPPSQLGASTRPVQTTPVASEKVGVVSEFVLE